MVNQKEKMTLSLLNKGFEKFNLLSWGNRGAILEKDFLRVGKSALFEMVLRYQKKSKENRRGTSLWRFIAVFYILVPQECPMG